MSEVTSVGVALTGFGHSYEIKVGHDLLRNSGEWARMTLPDTTEKIVIVSNSRVFGIYGAAVEASLSKAGFEVKTFLMNDGERFKSMKSLGDALAFIGANKLVRTDAIVALGGGVVGDLAGFASAVYLRGIPFLQIPTTFLSMIDSSVGGKTGVNTDFGKNLVGAFHQPNGVLIDVDVLSTLPRRELVAGLCEAIKHGAIAGRELFDMTADFLADYSVSSFRSRFDDPAFLKRLELLLARQVSFKASIVMNDEREDASRTDAKSRKILNFGHTLGHALEKVTNYRRLKHGEAVGYGILFAAELSKSLDLIDENELNLFNDVFRRLGRLPKLQDVAVDEIVQAFSFDKKKIGKSLQFILLEGIGRPVIVSDVDFSKTSFQKSLTKILH